MVPQGRTITMRRKCKYSAREVSWDFPCIYPTGENISQFLVRVLPKSNRENRYNPAKCRRQDGLPLTRARSLVVSFARSVPGNPPGFGHPHERVVGKPTTESRRHAEGHKKGLGVSRQIDSEQAGWPVIRELAAC